MNNMKYASFINTFTITDLSKQVSAIDLSPLQNEIDDLDNIVTNQQSALSNHQASIDGK